MVKNYNKLYALTIFGAFIGFNPINANQIYQETRLDGSDSISEYTLSILNYFKPKREIKQRERISSSLRRLDGDDGGTETEVASEIECEKYMYTSVSFMIEEAEK